MQWGIWFTMIILIFTVLAVFSMWTTVHLKYDTLTVHLMFF